jgi:DNA-binding MarR family transcriptional regulator
VTDDVAKSSEFASSRELLALDDSIGFRLARVARARRRAWSEEIEALELTPPQASALRGVVEQPNQSLRALARTLGTDPMSAKRCVDDLESRGLVRSTSAPGDRRPRVLNVTEPGLSLVQEIDRRVRRQEGSLRALLSPREYETLVKVLHRLEEHLNIVDPPDSMVSMDESE